MTTIHKCTRHLSSVNGQAPADSYYQRFQIMETVNHARFERQEAIDGIRMSWNTLPLLNGTDRADSIVPLGVLYTPLKNAQIVRINGDPDSCVNVNCGAVFNIHCIVTDGTTWTCNFCRQVNDTAVRRDLDHSTVEYVHSSLSSAHNGHFHDRSDQCEQGFRSASPSSASGR